MELVRSLNELNKQRWYPPLKAAFLLSFFAVQITGILMVLEKTEGKIIAPMSFSLVGKTVKEDMPAYRTMSDEEAGRNLYREDPVLWGEYVEKYEKKYLIDPMTRYRRFSQLQRIQFCAIAFLLIALFFEVLRRSFYYVVFGRVFPKKSRRLMIHDRSESADRP